jgi:hypothetical protein
MFPPAEVGTEFPDGIGVSTTRSFSVAHKKIERMKELERKRRRRRERLKQRVREARAAAS